MNREDFTYLLSYKENPIRITKKIATGSFGYVYQGEALRTRALVAIKLMKIGVGFTTIDSMNRERTMIERLMPRPHPNIVQYFKTIQLPNKLYLISELAESEDLFQTLQITNDAGEKVWKRLRELEFRHIITGMARGLQHMHDLDIAHGDVKLENVLLFYTTDPYVLAKEDNIVLYDRMTPKLTDFSNSKIRETTDPPGKIMINRPKCSLNYSAPESYSIDLVNKCYVTYDMIAADVFSMGCCLLAMTLGCLPYEPPVEKPVIADYRARNAKYYLYETFCTKLKRDTNYTASLVKYHPFPFRQVIKKLLDPIPDQRITINAFLNDVWVTRHESREVEEVGHELSFMNTDPLDYDWNYAESI